MNSSTKTGNIQNTIYLYPYNNWKSLVLD